MLEEEFSKEVEHFLRLQNKLDYKILIDYWTPDLHEIIFVDDKDKEFHLPNDK